ncbi:MAG: hypothetical protein EA350_04570 [Gemmatimonadales bacterium]|nr:MAG: hypothetical protein EA350_04570 [Gemmatimonadales bacterium]
MPGEGGSRVRRLPLPLPLPLLLLLHLPFWPGVQAQEPERTPSILPSPPLPVAVTGVVTDRRLGVPVASAAILVVWMDGDDAADGPPLQVLSGSSGRFAFPSLVPGRYLLAVSALGYSSVEEEIEVTGVSLLEIALVPEAVELEPVVVVTRRSRYLENVGFFQRREAGRARSTFTRDEVLAVSGNLLSDVLRTVPGVTLRRTRTETSAVLFRGGCQPDLVLDGVNLGRGAFIDDLIRPRDVEGLEVHRGGTMFLPFSNSACGALVVWTADPSARTGGDPWSWRRMIAAGWIVLGVLVLTR